MKVYVVEKWNTALERWDVILVTGNKKLIKEYENSTSYSVSEHSVVFS